MIISLIFSLFFISFYHVRSNFLFGFKTKSSVYLTSDKIFSPYGVVMKDNYEWIKDFSEEISIGFYGDSSDVEYLYGLIKKENSFQKYRTNGKGLSITELVNLSKYLICENLKTQPLKLNLIIAGFDKDKNEPSLNFLDNQGSVIPLNYSALGRDQPFILSLLDNFNTKLIQNCNGLTNLNKEEGLRLIKTCWTEINKRSIAKTGGYCGVCISSLGTDKFNSDS